MLVILLQMVLEKKSGFMQGPEIVIENINQAFVRVILSKLFN